MKFLLGIILLAFLSCPVNAGTLDCFQNFPQEIQFGKTYEAGTTFHKMTNNVIDYEKTAKGAGYSIPYMNTACVVLVHIFKTGNDISIPPRQTAKTISADISTTIRDYSISFHSTCSAMFRRADDNRRLAEAAAVTVQKAVSDTLKGCLR